MVSQLGAEHQRDQPGRGRHGRKPEQAGHRAEHQCRGGARRQRDECHHGERTTEIDDRQDVALRHPAAEIARRQRADDVEQADDSERPAADLGRETAVDQIGRQMHGDEGELEAAGEEAEHQQNIGAVPERLGRGLLHRLRSAAAARAGRAPRGAISVSDSGTIRSSRQEKISSVVCQPKLSIRLTAIGE